MYVKCIWLVGWSCKENRINYDALSNCFLLCSIFLRRVITDEWCFPDPNSKNTGLTDLISHVKILAIFLYMTNHTVSVRRTASCIQLPYLRWHQISQWNQGCMHAAMTSVLVRHTKPNAIARQWRQIFLTPAFQCPCLFCRVEMD